MPGVMDTMKKVGINADNSGQFSISTIEFPENRVFSVN
jgi:hypothetical protein